MFSQLIKMRSLGAYMCQFAFRRACNRNVTCRHINKLSFHSHRYFCKQSDDEIPHCNVGTIGHIDHGKTTLTAAITKTLSEEGKANFSDYDQIDRAPQEKARGITIHASHVGYSSSKRRYAHTDCPGHRDFVKNMICGTSQMDGAILVVAATDGPMPQTVEHISLAKALGVNTVIVYVNKADVVDEEVIELVVIEVKELLEQFGFDSENCPIIIGSALSALKGVNEDIGKNSVVQLIEALDSHVKLPERNLKGPLYVPVESVFTAPGRGTVVIGTISKGEVNKGDKVQILGFGRKFQTSVSDIQRFKTSVDTARAGENVGLLLRGVKKELLERGMVVCAENSLTQTDHFEAQLYIRTRDEGGRSKPIRENYQQQLFMDLFNMKCLLELPEDQAMIMPGDTVSTKILLRKPMVIQEGQSFIIRENELYVMSGKVLKLLPESKLRIPFFNVPGHQNVRLEGHDKGNKDPPKKNKKKK